MSYRTLNAHNIERTLETLLCRIQERFPERGLARLCAELLAIAREDRERLAWRKKPNLWLRGAIGLILVTGVAALTWLFTGITHMELDAEAISAVQGIEAVLNISALAGGGVWFLMNLETSIRRQAVLADLHELRSIAHVVDMHQLTKDPSQLDEDYATTPSSQKHGLTEFELMRYLDYCSEMLSLTGKLAALYMQDMRDPVVIETVNEIEDLTTSLSRKIWQKIMILNQAQQSRTA